MSIEPSAAGARRWPFVATTFAVPGSRTTLVACLLVALVTVASWLPRMSGSIDLRWDGGAYYIVGTSLAEGKGYRLQSEPGNFPSSVHAPFLPAFVAVHQRVLQTSDPAVVGPALRFTTLSFSVAYAVAIFLLLKTYIAWPWALAAPILGVFQPQYAYFSDALYAETFFGLFTVLFFILQRNRASLVSFLMAGLFAALAYEARTAGIALLVAWIADTLWRREFKRLPWVLVIAAIPVVTWMGWIRAAESSPEYRNPAYAYQTAPYLYFNVSYAKNIFTLKDPSNPHLGPLNRDALVGRVMTNLRELPFRVGEAVSSWAAPRELSLFLALLVFFGLIVQVARKQFLIVAYLILSMAAMALTPFNKQFIRYLLPLYPFLALAMFQCLTVAAREAGRRFPAIPPMLGQAAIGLVVAAAALVEWRDLRGLYEQHDRVYEQRDPSGDDRLFYYAPIGTEFDEALVWLQRRGRTSDVVAATDPQRAYLRTGMKAVLPPFEMDGTKAQLLIDTVPVRYLIAETAPQTLGLGAYHRYTSALLRDNPGRWTPIWKSSNGNVAIYERGPPCARGGAGGHPRAATGPCSF